MAHETDDYELDDYYEPAEDLRRRLQKKHTKGAWQHSRFGNEALVREAIAGPKKAAKNNHVVDAISTNRELQNRDWLVVNFIESLFENNEADSGLILFETAQNEARITDCVFLNNSRAVQSCRICFSENSGGVVNTQGRMGFPRVV